MSTILMSLLLLSKNLNLYQKKMLDWSFYIAPLLYVFIKFIINNIIFFFFKKFKIKH